MWIVFDGSTWATISRGRGTCILQYVLGWVKLNSNGGGEMSCKFILVIFVSLDFFPNVLNHDVGSQCFHVYEMPVLLIISHYTHIVVISSRHVFGFK